MAVSTISESTFESTIERRLLDHGFIAVNPDGFDRERAMFPEAVLGFIASSSSAELQFAPPPVATRNGLARPRP